MADQRLMHSCKSPKLSSINYKMYGELLPCRSRENIPLEAIDLWHTSIPWLPFPTPSKVSNYRLPCQITVSKNHQEECNLELPPKRLAQAIIKPKLQTDFSCCSYLFTGYGTSKLYDS